MKIIDRVDEYKYNPWLLFVGVVLITAILEQVHILSPFTATLQWVLQPVLTVESQVVQYLSWPIQAVRKTQQSYQQLLQLEAQYSQAASMATEAAVLKQENEELRALLGEKDRPTLPVKIVTPVISYGQPTIVVQPNSALSEGDVVIYGNTLLGRVGSVNQNQATVNLLNQPVLQPLLVKTEQNILGLVNGDGRRIVLSEVPSNTDLQKGQRLLTAGQPGVPPNLFVGVVGEPEKVPDLAVQTATVIQPVDFYRVHLVEVIK